jgi:uncharacterized protein YjiS (DUF1127 family)
LRNFPRPWAQRINAGPNEQEMIMSTLLSPASAAPLVADAPSLRRRIADTLKTVLGEVRARHHRRVAIAELERLDDRLLRDIGICRADIHRIVLSDGPHHRR